MLAENNLGDDDAMALVKALGTVETVRFDGRNLKIKSRTYYGWSLILLKELLLQLDIDLDTIQYYYILHHPPL